MNNTDQAGAFLALSMILREPVSHDNRLHFSKKCQEWYEQASAVPDTPKALTDHSCTLGKMGSQVIIDCEDGDVANDILDWLIEISCGPVNVSVSAFGELSDQDIDEFTQEVAKFMTNIRMKKILPKE